MISKFTKKQDLNYDMRNGKKKTNWFNWIYTVLLKIKDVTYKLSWGNELRANSNRKHKQIKQQSD